MGETKASEPVEKAPSARIGFLSENDVLALYRRRGVSEKTATMYLGQIRRAELYCQAHGLLIDTLDEHGLAGFVATLHPSRGVLHQTRAAFGTTGWPSAAPGRRS